METFIIILLAFVLILLIFTLIKLNKSAKPTPVSSSDVISSENSQALTGAVSAAVTQAVSEIMTGAVSNSVSSAVSSAVEKISVMNEKRFSEVYKSIGEMKEMSASVTDSVTSLHKILTNVKSRGTFAEIQLKNILDMTIPGHYEENFQPDISYSDRVEFAVKLPDESGEVTYLPIDSKFPLEDYARLCALTESGDSSGISEAEKALEKRILQEGKKIKKYINVPVTTPFAVMYLATEGLYAFVLSSSTGLFEKLQSEGIMVAGPSTVTALLSSFSMGFKTISVNEKAEEVRVQLETAVSQYEAFALSLQKAKKKIDEAAAAIDEAAKRNEIIRKKLS